MPYATSDDLVARFGSAQLLLIADRDGDGVLDGAVVAQALADASAIVDLSVRGIYAAPLNPVDLEIVGITCDLARTKLYSNSTEIPPSVAAADTAARALLAEITAGTLRLTAALFNTPSTQDPPQGAEIKAGPRMFTMDRMRGL